MRTLCVHQSLKLSTSKIKADWRKCCTNFKSIIKSNHFAYRVFSSFSGLDTAIELIELYIIDRTKPVRSQLPVSMRGAWHRSFKIEKSYLWIKALALLPSEKQYYHHFESFSFPVYILKLPGEESHSFITSFAESEIIRKNTIFFLIMMVSSSPLV